MPAAPEPRNVPLSGRVGRSLQTAGDPVDVVVGFPKEVRWI